MVRPCRQRPALHQPGRHQELRAVTDRCDRLVVAIEVGRTVELVRFDRNLCTPRSTCDLGVRPRRPGPRIAPACNRPTPAPPRAPPRGRSSPTSTAPTASSRCRSSRRSRSDGSRSPQRRSRSRSCSRSWPTSRSSSSSASAGSAPSRRTGRGHAGCSRGSAPGRSSSARSASYSRHHGHGWRSPFRSSSAPPWRGSSSVDWRRPSPVRSWSQRPSRRRRWRWPWQARSRSARRWAAGCPGCSRSRRRRWRSRWCWCAPGRRAGAIPGWAHAGAATALVLVGVAGIGLAGLPWATAVAVLPTALLSVVVCVSRVSPHRLRELGWAMVGSSALTMVILIAGLR